MVAQGLGPWHQPWLLRALVEWTSGWELALSILCRSAFQIEANNRILKSLVLSRQPGSDIRQSTEKAEQALRDCKHQTRARGRSSQLPCTGAPPQDTPEPHQGRWELKSGGKRKMRTNTENSEKCRACG